MIFSFIFSNRGLSELPFFNRFFWQAPASFEDYKVLYEQQLAEKDYDKAMESLDMMINYYSEGDLPDLAELWVWKGCLLALMGEYDATFEAFAFALGQGGDAAEIYLLETQFYAELNDYENTVVALENYLKVKPEDTNMRSTLAEVYMTYTQFKKAALEYEKLVAALPQSPENFFYLGYCRMQLKDYSLAVAAFDSAEALGGNYTNLHYYSAVCLMSLARYEEAIADYTHALEVNPSQAQVYRYNRGLCLVQMENYSQAAEDFKYSAVNGSDDEIKTTSASFLELLGVSLP